MSQKTTITITVEAKDRQGLGVRASHTVKELEIDPSEVDVKRIARQAAAALARVQMDNLRRRE